MKTLFHWLLAGGMLITGSINTLSTKAADNACSTNRFGELVPFNHPFLQAAGMFIGEGLCLIVFTLLYFRAKSTGAIDRGEFSVAKPHSKLIFLLPALCDMTGTSLMYVGLTFTSSSIFQMLRGCVILFTGVLSVIFLKRKLYAHHWLGMAIVLAATAIVGSATYICGSGDSGGNNSKAMLGNGLVIAAQVIVAVQMVIEEKLIGGYDVPALQVVGWEGTWGFTVLSGVLGIMYAVKSQGDFCTAPDTSTCPSSPPTPYPAHCEHFEDSWDAFVQIGNNWKVPFFLSLNIMSIAFFNYFGVSVTKHINAATRMVLDSLRTMVIWGFSLAIGWEKFCYVQIIGFVLLLAGTMIYNELLRVPFLSYPDAADGSGSGGDEAAGKLLGVEELGDEYSLLPGTGGGSGPFSGSVNSFAPAGGKGKGRR